MAVYLPPWLSVNPSDFVQAAAAGGRLGAELAQMRTQALESGARINAGLQEAQLRSNVESAGQQAANQRAAQEQALREWETKQQIIHQQNQIQAENERNQNTVSAENQRAANTLANTQAYQLGELGLREAANRIAQQNADINAKKLSDSEAYIKGTAIYPGSKGVPQFSASDPGKSGIWLLRDKVPASSLTTTNAADLNAWLAQHPSATTTTNIAPGTATPSIHVPIRIPNGNISSPSQPPTTTPPPGTSMVPMYTMKQMYTIRPSVTESDSGSQSPLEGKRVRDKATNKTGVITNGEFVPDDEGNPFDM